MLREQTVDVLYAHGFDTAAALVASGEKGPYWGAWHVERRLDTYPGRARRCLDALRALDVDTRQQKGGPACD